jgi:transcriptional regulator with XRE-family HTH domain
MPRWQLRSILGMAGKGLLGAFGQVVREARLSQGLTQEELAFNAGLNRNFVMSIEKGRRKPSIITIFSLAKGLGISPSVLVSRTDQLMR